jgi:phosphoribosylglycinamide formyltransferase-1
MKNIVLFASGSGSNVEKIIQYFKDKNNVTIASIFSNNAIAQVLEKAKFYQIEGHIVTKEELNTSQFAEKVRKLNPDLIILAGFLLKFPAEIISHFPNKIINIHPALLPKYGGKGMYGMHVHEAVLENNEMETGITIHYVNENYDEGAFIFQQSVTIEECSTAEDIAAKVLQLEHYHFPIIIEKLLTT